MSLKTRLMRAGRAFFAEHHESTKKGHELIFISRIRRDGSGTDPVEITNTLLNDNYRLRCLSITRGTYIASEVSSYVVKVIKDEKEKYNGVPKMRNPPKPPQKT